MGRFYPKLTLERVCKTVDTRRKTADNADAGYACATSRCLRYAPTCFAAALWSPNRVLSSKAAPKRLRSRSALADSDELRDRREHLRYLRFFQITTVIIQDKI